MAKAEKIDSKYIIVRSKSTGVEHKYPSRLWQTGKNSDRNDTDLEFVKEVKDKKKKAE